MTQSKRGSCEQGEDNEGEREREREREKERGRVGERDREIGREREREQHVVCGKKPKPPAWMHECINTYTK